MKKSIPLATLALFLLLLDGDRKPNQQAAQDQEDRPYFSLFSEVASLINSEYVEAVSPQEKIPGAFDAMAKSLDPLSAYLDGEKTRLYELYQQNKIAGCGIYGLRIQNFFIISNILEGSPAERAGLKRGDMIKAVNGRSIFALSYWSMVLTLFASEEKDLEIVIIKKDETKPQKMIVSTEFLQPRTTIKPLPDNTFLIQLKRIDPESVARLGQFKKPGLRFIFDLRKYSGGDWESFLALCKLLINPNQLILKTKKQKETIMLGSGANLKYRAVAIVDSSTILYGELLAALFKKQSIDLIGEKTPGYLAQQQPFYFPDGSCLLLSTGFYLLNHQDSMPTGVTPTIALKEANLNQAVETALAVLKKTDASKEQR